MDVVSPNVHSDSDDHHEGHDKGGQVVKDKSDEVHRVFVSYDVFEEFYFIPTVKLLSNSINNLFPIFVNFKLKFSLLLLFLLPTCISKS